MARHTFVLGNGRRIQFCPSPIEKGSIQLRLMDADRSNIGTFTVPAETAAVMAAALDLEATAAAELLDSDAGKAHRYGTICSGDPCICGAMASNGLFLVEFSGLNEFS